MPGQILTTTATPKDVIDRLLALFTKLTEDYPTVLSTIDLDGECELFDEYLPCLIGLASRGVVEAVPRGTDTILVTRNYEFRVLYSRIKSSALEDQLAAVNAANERMNDIPGWLKRFPRLELERAALRGVVGTGYAADADGATLEHWRDMEWAGVTYLLPITTNG
jgi:hypothetical protein